MVRNGVRTTNKYGPSNPVTESGRVLGDDSPALIALFTLVSIESGDGKFGLTLYRSNLFINPSFLGDVVDSVRNLLWEDDAIVHTSRNIPPQLNRSSLILSFHFAHYRYVLSYINRDRSFLSEVETVVGYDVIGVLSARSSIIRNRQNTAWCGVLDGLYGAFTIENDHLSDVCKCRTIDGFRWSMERNGSLKSCCCVRGSRQLGSGSRCFRLCSPLNSDGVEDNHVSVRSRKGMEPDAIITVNSGL